MYAQLGEIIFEGLVGFETLTEQFGVNLPELPLIQGKPRLQRVGDNLDQISIDIRFHAAFCNPDAEIDNLKTYLENSDVLPLLRGDGVLMGTFVIRSINKGTIQTDDKGRTIEAVIGLDLIEAVQSPNSESPSGFATESNSPSIIKPTVRRQGEAAFLMGKNAAVNSTASSVNTNVDTLDKNRNFAESMLDTIQRGLKKVQGALSDMQASLQAAKNEYQSAERIYAAIEATQNYVVSSLEHAQEGDVDGLIQSNKDMMGGVTRLNGASVELSNLVTTRRG